MLSAGLKEGSCRNLLSTGNTRILEKEIRQEIPVACEMGGRRATPVAPGRTNKIGAYR